jgi:hypothetical protein
MALDPVHPSHENVAIDENVVESSHAVCGGVIVTAS